MKKMYKIKEMGNYIYYDDLDLMDQEMCDKVVENYPWMLMYVSDQFTTHKMCDIAVDKYHWCFKSVPDKFKTQKMCQIVLKAKKGVVINLALVKTLMISQIGL